MYIRKCIYAQGVSHWELLSAEFSALKTFYIYLILFGIKEDDQPPFTFLNSQNVLSSWKLHEGLFFIAISEGYHTFTGFIYFQRKDSPEFMVLNKKKNTFYISKVLFYISILQKWQSTHKVSYRIEYIFNIS